jgi:hypothetical protein
MFFIYCVWEFLYIEWDWRGLGKGLCIFGWEFVVLEIALDRIIASSLCSGESTW